MDMQACRNDFNTSLIHPVIIIENQNINASRVMEQMTGSESIGKNEIYLQFFTFKK